MEAEDYRRAFRAGQLLEAAAISPAGLRSAFGTVADLLGGEMFQFIDVSNPAAPDLVVAPGVEGLVRDYIVDGWHERDTYTHAALPLAKHGVLISSDFISAEERVRDPFWQDFCRKWRMGRFDSRLFDFAGHTWSFTLMTRASGALPADQRGALEIVLPAADRAAMLAAAFKDIRAIGVTDGIGLSGRPALLLDHHGRVMTATAEAEKLIGDCLTVRGGCLFGMTTRSDAALRQLAKIAALSRPPPMQNFLLERADGRRPVLAMPVAVRDRGMEAWPGARVILMFADPEARRTAAEEHLEAIFRLTPREIELTQALGRGDELEVAAAGMGIKLSTARFMMKAIFQKTGTRRQAELVALVGAL